MTINETRNSRKVLTCPRELAAEVDAYRREQASIPSESRAFVDLVRKGLEKWREERDEKKRRKR